MIRTYLMKTPGWNEDRLPFELSDSERADTVLSINVLQHVVVKEIFVVQQRRGVLRCDVEALPQKHLHLGRVARIKDDPFRTSPFTGRVIRRCVRVHQEVDRSCHVQVESGRTYALSIHNIGACEIHFRT